MIFKNLWEFHSSKIISYSLAWATYLNETTLFNCAKCPSFFSPTTCSPSPHRQMPHCYILSMPSIHAFLGWRLLSSQPSVFWSSSGSRGSGNIHLTIQLPLFPNPLLLLSVNYIKHSQADEHRTHSVNFTMIYFSADGIIKAEAVHISQSMIFATLSQLGTSLIRTLLTFSGA